jgi:glycosyltransferase involved in cell wall biosynthesis
MRILYVIDSLVPAGAEQSLVTMLPHLVERGIEPVVVHLSSALGLQDRVDSEDITRVALDPASRRDAVRLLRRTIGRFRPDLVHTTLFEADQAGRTAAALSRVPVVSTLPTISYGRDQIADRQVTPHRLRAAWAVDVTTSRLVRRFHAVSDTVAEVMSRRLVVSRQKIDVVYRGRDPEVLGRRSGARREAVRNRLGVDEGADVVLAVARHEYPKGLDVLFESLGHLRSQPTVLIAGRPGRHTEELESIMRRLGLTTVQMLGHRDDTADLMVAADLAVFSSRWEGMPGAVVEAMALEVPILASDIPQHREVLDEAALGYFASGDADALASAIEAALASPGNDRQTRCDLGRERFETHFTVGAVADDMTTFYDRALDRSSSR